MIGYLTNFNYEFNDNVTAYGSVKYVDTDVIQLFQPAFFFGSIDINVNENPFLDDDLRQELLDAGQPIVGFAKFFDELGFRLADNNRELLQYSVGAKGQFDIGDTNFDYDVYYVYGESENVRTTPNDVITGNAMAAFDAVIDPGTGLPACRSQVPSAQGPDFEDPATFAPENCVAYNLFGFQQASQEAMDFISAPGTRSDRIDQKVFGAVFSADTNTFFNLPGGPIDFIFGYEYRKESSSTVSDALILSDVLGTAATPNNFGEFDVSDYFVEVNLPLLADVPGVKELSIDAAYRSANYSHAGSADAWKVGLLYAPAESFRLRGTIGEAVRAPSIAEAFDALSPSFSQIDDPCDADNIGDGPDRAANCAALGIPAGFQANDNVSIDILSGGNPNLVSEISDSYTAGFVWQPHFLEGFSLTADYYNIDISDAILLVSAQDILDNCVGATGGLDAGFCAQIDRDPVTRDVDLVRSGFLNASAFTTKGVELSAVYNGLSLESINLPGTIDLNFFVNRLLELDFFEFQSRPDELNAEAGEVGDPDTQYRLSATYRLDDLNINWSLRYIDRSANYDVSPTGDTPEDVSPAYTPSITTHNLSANYELTDNISVLVGIRNLTDKVPPGFISNALYDLVGRRVFFGVNARF